MSAAVPAPLDDSRTAARYAMIRSALREAILAGRAAPGLVLVEAPLAQLFGTSRVPVRQALTLLQEEGLIRRFEGRGYLIDPAGTAGEPQRQPLTRQLLGLDSSDDLIGRWNRFERHKKHPILKIRQQLFGSLNCQTGLAHTARTHQRQQAAVGMANTLGNLLDFVLPSDKRGRLRRQIVSGFVGRQEGRRVEKLKGLRPDDGFGSTAYIQLAKNVLVVPFDRSFG